MPSSLVRTLELCPETLFEERLIIIFNIFIILVIWKPSRWPSRRLHTGSAQGGVSGLRFVGRLRPAFCQRDIHTV